MSNWKNLNDVEISTEFGFGEIVVGNKYAIDCQDGSTAGWELLDADELTAQIYDVVGGEYIPKAIVYLMAGRDIFAGLFATGAIPNKSPTDPTCVFWRVDY